MEEESEWNNAEAWSAQFCVTDGSITSAGINNDADVVSKSNSENLPNVEDPIDDDVEAANALERLLTFTTKPEQVISGPSFYPREADMHSDEVPVDPEQFPTVQEVASSDATTIPRMPPFQRVSTQSADKATRKQKNKAQFTDAYNRCQDPDCKDDKCDDVTTKSPIDAATEQIPDDKEKRPHCGPASQQADTTEGKSKKQCSENSADEKIPDQPNDNETINKVNDSTANNVHFKDVAAPWKPETCGCTGCRQYSQVTGEHLGTCIFNKDGSLRNPAAYASGWRTDPKNQPVVRNSKTYECPIPGGEPVSMGPIAQPDEKTFNISKKYIKLLNKLEDASNKADMFVLEADGRLHDMFMQGLITDGDTSSVNNVGKTMNWVQIAVVVDSGSVVHVCPQSVFSLTMDPNDMSKRGATFFAADKSPIKKLGQHNNESLP